MLLACPAAVIDTWERLNPAHSNTVEIDRIRFARKAGECDVLDIARFDVAGEERAFVEGPSGRESTLVNLSAWRRFRGKGWYVFSGSGSRRCIPGKMSYRLRLPEEERPCSRVPMLR